MRSSQVSSHLTRITMLAHFFFFVATPEECDAALEKHYGQDVIDSLSVLEAAVPTFHPELWPKVTELFPMMHLALQSKFAIIRQSVAKCFAAICEVITADAMRFVVEQVVPLISDPIVLANRQGATELIYRELRKVLYMIRTPANFVKRYCPEVRYQGSSLCHFLGGSYLRTDE